IDLSPPDSPDKYSSTNFILNSFVYFGIQKPLHPYSGFWGSGHKASFFMGRNMEIGKEFRKTTVAGYT
ncbi:hypothetical protein ACU68U_08385, partial [Finegoldia sp. P3-F-LR]